MNGDGQVSIADFIELSAAFNSFFRAN